MIINLVVHQDSYSYAVECDICGCRSGRGYGEVLCSIPNSRCRCKYWHTREICQDCLEAGSASFSSRLQERARAIEGKIPERAQELRQLANAEWWPIPDRTYDENDIDESWSRQSELSSKKFPRVTLRRKFAEDPRFAGGDPKRLAALLLASYECGEQGFSENDPTFVSRCDALYNMSDEEFDREHSRVLSLNRSP